MQGRGAASQPLSALMPTKLAQQEQAPGRAARPLTRRSLSQTTGSNCSARPMESEETEEPPAGHDRHRSPTGSERANSRLRPQAQSPLSVGPSWITAPAV